MKARFFIFAAILPLLLWACGGNGDTGKIRLIKTAPGTPQRSM